MIAHSLPGDFFGPAQGLHGATFVIDAEFARTELDAHNVVLDLGLASRVVGEVADSLNYRNLDEMPGLEAEVTTAEFLARYVHDAVRGRLGVGFHGRLKVSLQESHVASAAYEGEVF